MRAFDLTVSGSLVLEGGGTSLSGSSTSTGSFGRIEANNLLYDGKVLDVGRSSVADPTILIDSATGGDPLLIFDTGASNRTPQIQFKDQGTNIGFIKYLHNGDLMNFGAGSSTSIRMTVSEAAIEFPTANVKVSGSSTSTGSFGRIYVDGADGAVNIDTNIQVPGGAVANPSYAFTNDTSTGMSRPTSNAINFVTAGSERMRVDGSGRVLIGHTTAIAAVNTLNFQINGTDNDNGVSINQWGSNAAHQGFLYFNHSKSGTAGSHTALANTDAIGAIYWQGSDGTDFANSSARIAVTVDGSVSSNRVPGRITFETAEGAADNDILPKMTIRADGKVGIGETSPDKTLHVTDTGDTPVKIEHSDGTDTYIELRNNAGAAYIGSTTDDISFRTEAAGNERLRITSTNKISGSATSTGSFGMVGIGTASPGAKLEIVGSGGTKIGFDATYPNVIVGQPESTGDTGELAFNYVGYNYGTTKFRDVNIYDGKQNKIAVFDGSSGNVGIGTTTPDFKLDVDGDIRATGNIHAQNYIVSSSVTSMSFAQNSGSTIFGDSSDDIHEFIGNKISGSSTSTGSFARMTLRGATKQLALFSGTTKYMEFDQNVISTHGSTNFFLDAADSLIFRTNGSTEAARINSSRDFLMGNSVVNPASGFSNQRGFGYDNSTGQVQIASSTNTAAMQIGKNESTAGAIVIFRHESNSVAEIDTAGGISGSSSSTGSFGDGFLDDKLFIGANHTPGIQAGDLHIASEAPGVGNIVLEAAANATSGPALYMGKARGTNASISAINHAGGDVLGNILFAGYDGAHYRTGAEITVTNQSGSSQGTDMPANMFLRVSDDGSSSPTDRLVLTHDNKISGSSTSTGSFGHGFINRRLLVGAQQATDSGEIFGVKDGVSADWAARLENTTDGGYGALVKVGGTGSGHIVFQTRASSTNILTVKGNSTVGIGVTDPDSFLEIKGTGTTSQQYIRLRNSDDTQQMEFASDGSGVPFLGIGNAAGSTKISLSSGGSSFSAGDVTVVGGNVGIGTTTVPDRRGDATLQLNGMLIVSQSTSGGDHHLEGIEIHRANVAGQYGRINQQGGATHIVSYVEGGGTRGTLNLMGGNSYSGAPVSYLQLGQNAGGTGGIISGSATSTGSFGRVHIGSPTAGASPYTSTALSFAPANHVDRIWQLNYDDGGAVGAGFNIAYQGSRKFYINGGNGRIGIGTASPAAPLHIVGDTMLLADGEADNAIKQGRIGSEHYDVDEEPFYYLYSIIQSDNNQINIGGGTSAGNAATNIQFYTAANNTTTTGTKLFELTSTGGNKISGSARSTGSFGAIAVGLDYADLYQGAKSIYTKGYIDINGNGGLSFNDNTSTGYFYGSNVATISSGNNIQFKTYPGAGGYRERMRIDNSGHVGIGATTPLYELHVSSSQGGTTPTVFVEGDVSSSAGGTGSFGNVEAGTKLYVGSNTPVGGVVANIQSPDDTKLRVSTGNASYYTELKASISSHTPMQLIGTGGHVILKQRIGSTRLHLFANNTRRVAVTDSGLEVTGSITGHTLTSISGSATSTGSFGVLTIGETGGTANAQTGAQSLVAENGITIYNTGTGRLNFSDGAGSGDSSYKGVIKYNHSSNKLTFAANSVDYMTIIPGGSVGIGTDSPETKLHVVGSNTTSGDLYTVVGSGNVPSITIQNSSATANNNAGLFFRDNDAMAASVHTRFTNHSTMASQLRFSTAVGGNTREKVIINESGSLGIGTMSPSEPLHVKGDRGGAYVARFHNDGDNANRYGIVIQAGADDGSGTTNYILFEDGDGGDVGVASNDSGTFSVSDLSDARKKKNIRDTKVKGLDSVNAIKVRDFEWIKNDMSVNAGLVAQELEEVFPDAVTEFGDDDLLAVSRERLVPLLIKAVQELSEKVESQQKEIEELKNK